MPGLKSKDHDVEVVELQSDSDDTRSSSEGSHTSTVNSVVHYLGDDENKVEQITEESHATEEWKADRRVVLIMSCIAMVNTMVALDASGEWNHLSHNLQRTY